VGPLKLGQFVAGMQSFIIAYLSLLLLMTALWVQPPLNRDSDDSCD
jgi:hypothetical protein